MGRQEDVDNGGATYRKDIGGDFVDGVESDGPTCKTVPADHKVAEEVSALLLLRLVYIIQY